MQTQITCPRCKREAKILTARTGSNAGKQFAKCLTCDKWLQWVENDAQPIEMREMTHAATTNKINKFRKFAAQPKAEKIPFPSTFVPSAFQQVIAEFVRDETGNLRKEAVAGSGKTTSNIYDTTLLPVTLKVEMMVFSKQNQIDMERRVPENVKATTAHASGLKDIKAMYPDTELAEKDGRDTKMWGLFNDYAPQDDESERGKNLQANAAEILKLVSLCKNTLTEPEPAQLDDLCDHFDVLANGDREEVYSAVKWLFNRSRETIPNLINFDDMVFAPAARIVPTHKCDLLFVDEAQDTNKAQQEYYLQVGKRIVFVGDVHQAIYGFRGADAYAMQNLSTALSAHQLPLSVSYRCPVKVIELAQRIVPQILPRPNAPEGVIGNLTDSQFLTKVTPGDMVLCRLNAPLVKPCFELIRRGVKATIRGREIGKGLVNLIRRLQKRHKLGNERVTELIVELNQYSECECHRLRLSHKESQATVLEDQVLTILAMSDGVNTITNLIERIDNIFSDTVNGVVFSSIHKAKGLESNNVFIVAPDTIPFSRATQSWQIEQEMNLAYVAVTRAMQELYFVGETPMLFAGAV